MRRWNRGRGVFRGYEGLWGVSGRGCPGGVGALRLGLLCLQPAYRRGPVRGRDHGLALVLPYFRCHAHLCGKATSSGSARHVDCRARGGCATGCLVARWVCRLDRRLRGVRGGCRARKDRCKSRGVSRCLPWCGAARAVCGKCWRKGNDLGRECR